MHTIAHIENDFPEKFGIPRQSGLVNELISTIVFEPKFRNPDALRGLEEYDYIWLIWGFEGFGNEGDLTWSPTVRPPRLGGNTHIGVFATRSPNRPNPIALSCVKLIDIQSSERGPILLVAGADLRNGTQIYDIKPYLPYTDAHPDALAGFSSAVMDKKLSVHIPDELRGCMPKDKIKTVENLLAQDPRPSYHNDPNRVYGMSYAQYNIQFKVDGDRLTVLSISSK